MGPNYRRAFDGMYPTLAAKYHARLYPFFLDGVAGNRALIQADGLHPNPKGVQIIIGRMVPAVKAALKD
jgi:acyl-CoA thioesterase-1